MKKVTKKQHPPGVGLTQDDLKAWQDFVNGSAGRYLPTGRYLIANESSQRRHNKKLDLHGMTIQDAYVRTTRFLQEHWSVGTRSVVLVCGKGGKISDELPVWCKNLGFIRECTPNIDSTGEFGSYTIKFMKRK